MGLGIPRENKPNKYQAAAQFAEIIRLDPQYSAAYRYLGQAYAALGWRAEAAETFQRGIAIAETRGDL